MDQGELRQAAENFERVARQMSVTVPLAETMLRGMDSVIARVKAEEINSPMEWHEIPFGYLSADGELSAYPELEDAYANFKLKLCNISISDKLV
ncbi:hypothetical protein HDE80_001528 [Rhodanobacter sp. A1T4]|nr:hypothetical protein [Rhodanobacter sp. A1T4]